MQFNDHRSLAGCHAPFGASKSSWLRYDDNKAAEVYLNMKAKEMGTRLHAWAAETIDLRIKQPRSRKTINMYINDAIGFQMDTEVVLFYSKNFFGTADSISFRYEKAFDSNVLRIHDLKTGVKPADMEQLMIYAALFCLEYRVKPGEIKIELRIYQNDEIKYHNPETDEILPIMDTIQRFDKMINKMNGEV